MILLSYNVLNNENTVRKYIVGFMEAPTQNWVFN